MFQIGTFAELELSIIPGIPGGLRWACAPGPKENGFARSEKTDQGADGLEVGGRSQDAREIILFVTAITSSAG